MYCNKYLFSPFFFSGEKEKKKTQCPCGTASCMFCTSNMYCSVVWYGKPCFYILTASPLSFPCQNRLFVGSRNDTNPTIPFQPPGVKRSVYNHPTIIAPAPIVRPLPLALSNRAQAVPLTKTYWPKPSSFSRMTEPQAMSLMKTSEQQANKFVLVAESKQPSILTKDYTTPTQSSGPKNISSIPSMSR